jgi:hypothetical protein
MKNFYGEDINEGDDVRLRTGGIKAVWMIAKKVGNFPNKNVEKGALCIWQTKGGVPKEKVYDIDSLTKDVGTLGEIG